MMWRHDNESLCYAIWFHKNLVRTLSNFHTPKVVDSGIKRRRRVNSILEREPVAVPCPHQNVDYSETFRLIDKGNGAEAKYELRGQSRSHGWTPKLSCRLFNMNVNNFYRIYLSLTTYTPAKPTPVMSCFNSCINTANNDRKRWTSSNIDRRNLWKSRNSAISITRNSLKLS